MLDEERGRLRPRSECRVTDEPAQEREVRDDPLDGGLVEREPQLVQCFPPIGAVRDQLREQGVVRDPDLVSFRHAFVDAHIPRENESADAPCLRQERGGILCVEPRLDCVAALLDLELDCLSGRDAKLQLDDVEPCDGLCDRVLHLDPAVQLEEEDVASVHEELGSTGARVADRLCEGSRAGCDARPGERVELRSRRLLDQLLVTPLDRAVTSSEDGDASFVPEHLGFDVTWPLEVALVEDGVVAERALRLAPRGCKSVVELHRGADDTHAAATASRCGLDDERVADVVRGALRQRRHRVLDGNPLRGELVAAEPERCGRGPDPGDARLADVGGEGRVLCEEAVARVDRVDSRLEGSSDMLGRVEIRRDLQRLVGRPRVERAAVV